MHLETFAIIVGMALVTFATRFSSVALFRQTGIPGWLERWLKHIPTAILTALIVPSLVLPKGQLDLSFHNHYLLAGIVAAIVAYKSRNIVVTLTTGMGTMLALRWLFF
ncbi:AzlD domain-containing protein [Sporolituus thermophilus]|uniref:Branched-chain amino acid transport protein n=1 Tax=Sporolituus thermophilus DSM 23256 TaxID=1123285 RepID=A0A1G7KA75_9FIRM|nr:AzlD domain-containing protein [Sporolituus thermophilus]SDF33921.1 Branched-chain amino acid transport protein [Sporolituus thermophilus DSM 23256]